MSSPNVKAHSHTCRPFGESRLPRSAIAMRAVAAENSSQRTSACCAVCVEVEWHSKDAHHPMGRLACEIASHEQTWLDHYSDFGGLRTCKEAAGAVWRSATHVSSMKIESAQLRNRDYCCIVVVSCGNNPQSRSCRGWDEAMWFLTKLPFKIRIVVIKV